MIDSNETRVLRVSLDDVEPEIWRVFEVEADFTLGELHDVLISAMGWGDSHLHSFGVGEVMYSAVYESLETIGEDEEGITVAVALPDVGSSIGWMYDWGDGWGHTIKVENSGTVQDDVTYPVLYDGVRACPPEDCGGPFGYMEIVKMFDDPSYMSDVIDRDEVMDWLDPDFRPGTFHANKAQWLMRNPHPKGPG